MRNGCPPVTGKLCERLSTAGPKRWAVMFTSVRIVVKYNIAITPAVIGTVRNASRVLLNSGWKSKRICCYQPPYFMLTFTLPDGLRRVARSHQKLFYNLLFRASAAATQKLAQAPRFIGGQVGMVGVLHTWGRTLTYHPHVHYLVPAGGVGKDGNWLPARNAFLLPVKALAKIFRAKFRQALRKSACYDVVPSKVWRRPWVVHCKSVGDGASALKYLAPYIFRVAISNKRIARMTDTHISFRYRSTKTGKIKTCTLSAEEFIRRFLQHVLPKGFVKVRYYGFFSPGLRTKLASVHEQLDGLAQQVTSGHQQYQQQHRKVL